MRFQEVVTKKSVFGTRLERENAHFLMAVKGKNEALAWEWCIFLQKLVSMVKSKKKAPEDAFGRPFWLQNGAIIHPKSPTEKQSKN